MGHQGHDTRVLAQLRRGAIRLIDRFHDVQPVHARFRARIAVGAALQGILVGAASLVASLVSGNVTSAVLLGVFLVLVVAQLAAIRLAAPVTVVSWTLLCTLGAFLVADSLTTRDLHAEQPFWLVLLPLATFLTHRTRAGDAEPSGVRAPVLAAVGAIVGGLIIIFAHDAGLTLDHGGVPTPGWVRAVNFGLFIAATSGLLFIHDVSVQESALELAQLRRLLAVCAWCKKIRDEGDWVPLERYLEKHQRQDLTHGICPHCLERMTADSASRKRAG